MIFCLFIFKDATSTYAEVWRYDICCEFLPYYLSYSWAEKVLFIGQTVLMFKMGINKRHKKETDWNGDTEKNSSSTSNVITSSSGTTAITSVSATTTYSNYSLWDNQEHKFLQMIQNLHDNEDDVIVSQYEKVIDDIKSYVTERLSQIAVKQADLVKQLKLIKDFYLLGRGELFLEFIKRTHSLEKSTDGTTTVLNENTIRDLVKAFDVNSIDFHNFIYFKLIFIYFLFLNNFRVLQIV